MSNKFYLAAKFARKEEMEKLANELSSFKDWECTARWVYGGEDGLTLEDISDLDLCDVERSDVLILFTEKYGSENSGGGRFVEFGYALAKGLRCYVIGDYEMVFCHDPRVKVFPDWETFLHCMIPPSEKRINE